MPSLNTWSLLFEVDILLSIGKLFPGLKFSGRRKHTSLCILLSLEGENFISSFPSLNWRREIMEAVEERAKALYKLTMTTWIYWVLTLCPALCLLIIDYVVYCSKVPLKLGTLLTHYIDEERQAHKDNVNSSALHT